MNVSQPVEFAFILGTVGVIAGIIALGIFFVKKGAASRRGE